MEYKQYQMNLTVLQMNTTMLGGGKGKKEPT